MRSAVKRVSLNRFMESSRGATRYFSDSQGKIFGEEERAAETIYIKVFPFAPFDPSISFAEVKEARWLRKFIDSCCFPWFTAFVLKHAKSHEVDAIRVWFGKLFSFGFMWLSIMSSIDDAWKSFFPSLTVFAVSENGEGEIGEAEEESWAREGTEREGGCRQGKINFFFITTEAVKKNLEVL